jgi:hypothetical protein
MSLSFALDVWQMMCSYVLSPSILTAIIKFLEGGAQQMLIRHLLLSSCWLRLHTWQPVELSALNKQYLFLINPATAYFEQHLLVE